MIKTSVQTQKQIKKVGINPAGGNAGPSSSHYEGTKKGSPSVSIVKTLTGMVMGKRLMLGGKVHGAKKKAKKRKID